jgi:hypothetical protein
MQNPFEHISLDSWFWSTVRPWSMPEFLSAHTLHDSHLWEFRTCPPSEGVLLILFDLVWNKTVPRDYDRLVLRLPSMRKAIWTAGVATWGQTTVAGATTALVSPHDRMKLLEDGLQRAVPNEPDAVLEHLMDENLARTTIDCMDWGKLVLLHCNTVFAVCADESGRTFDLARER